MKVIRFLYKKQKSHIFGVIHRPIANVEFWSNKFKRWLNFTLIVDTGADYTIFPYSKATDLGIDLEKDCKPFETHGIGGAESVYVFKGQRMKLGDIELNIPVGFLERDDIPPLLGRVKCLDKFRVKFYYFITSFSKNNV